VARVRGVVATAVATVALCVSAQPAVAAGLERCGKDAAPTCRTLTVPLDRTGAVPGTVKLRIQRHRARDRATRPPLFLLAGGPGQSAIDAFGSARQIRELVGPATVTRDVIVMDQRGSGRSGLLDCPAVQRGRDDAIEACAARLGPAREYYRAADMAADVDSVRAALGAERIALFAVSYGTKVALAYASGHRDHVERLVLDSPVGPAGVDLLSRSSMRAAPAAMAATCGRHCRSFTRDPAGDLRAVAERAERGPLRGLVTRPSGRRRPAAIGGAELLTLVTVADVDPLVASLVPGALRRAAQGDPALLLRAAALARRSDSSPIPARALSLTAYLATLCTDSQLPWGASTLPADRIAAATALADGLGAAPFAPFGPRTAVRGEALRACARWPLSTPRPTPALAPPADVPALIFAGARDVRTPVADARAVAALFPRADLRVVRNAGHSVTGAGGTCPRRATHRFLLDRPPGPCREGLVVGATGLLGIAPPPPSRFADLPTGRMPPKIGRTLTAVAWTSLDMVSATFPDLVRATAHLRRLRDVRRVRVTAGGLRGGRYVMRLLGTSRMDRASAIPGVRVTGSVTMDPEERGESRLRIGGRAAAPGYLVFDRRGVRGRLGGRPVRVARRQLNRMFVGLMAAEREPDPLQMLAAAQRAWRDLPQRLRAAGQTPPNPFR